MNRLLAIFGCLLLVACGTEMETSSTHDFNDFGASLAPIGGTQPEGFCTKDINPYGHPSVCNCPAGSKYDQQIGLCVAGGPVKAVLDWSDDANSLQAVLFGALRQAKIGDKEIFLKKVELRDAESSIVCETDGYRYRCILDLPSSELAWTSDADSVQARLFEALFQTRGVSANGLEIEVGEGANKLVCSSATLGMAQVMSYRCRFELGHAILPTPRG